ncbi:hypothetical protein SPPR111872_00015 [Sphingobacterium prati]
MLMISVLITTLATIGIGPGYYHDRLLFNLARLIPKHNIHYLLQAKRYQMLYSSADDQQLVSLFCFAI